MVWVQSEKIITDLEKNHLLKNSRADINENFIKCNTYAVENLAGPVQLATLYELQEGEGAGAITPQLLNNLSTGLSYPIKCTYNVQIEESLHDSYYITSGFAKTNFLRRDTGAFPTITNAYDLGTPDNKWRKIYGVSFEGDYFSGIASSAQYADIAENYTIKNTKKIGTFISVSLDENYDIEESNTIADPKCFGVISEKPAYLMDSELKNAQPVALTGKIDARIVGPIKKGDRIVTSKIAGCGKAAEVTEYVCTVAWSLETNLSEVEKLVKVIVK